MISYNWQLIEKDCVQQRGLKEQKVKAYFLYKEKVDENLYFYSVSPKNMKNGLKNIAIDIQGKAFTRKDFDAIDDIKVKNKTYVSLEKTLVINNNSLNEYLPNSNLYLSARYLKFKKEYMIKLFNELLLRHWKKDEFKKIQSAFDDSVFSKKIYYYLLNNNIYTHKFQNFISILSQNFIALSKKKQVQLPLLKNIALSSFLDNDILKMYTPLFFLNPRNNIFDAREKNFMYAMSLDLILKHILHKKNDFLMDDSNKQVLFNNLNFLSENKLSDFGYINTTVLKKKYSKNIFKNKKSLFQIKAVLSKKFITKNTLSYYLLPNITNMEFNRYVKEHKYIISYFLKHKISLLRLKSS